MKELWYKINQLPDLTLNKYASLDNAGVSAVLEKHIAFLRQLNRKGIVSNVSFHLFYLYVSANESIINNNGHKLQIYFLVKGSEESTQNIGAIISASPLSDFYKFESCESIFNNAYINKDGLNFSTCSFLTKTETYLSSKMSDGEKYYMIRDWEMNESGRLYNMCKMMEALDRTALYRIDIYPVEKSASLRDALSKPMGVLRKRQEEQSFNARKDYVGKDVLQNYEELIEKFDFSPHFITNIMVFANSKEDCTSILDATGSESLIKGKYNITTFSSLFNATSFLSGSFEPLENMRERMVLRQSKPGITICQYNRNKFKLFANIVFFRRTCAIF